MTPGEFNVESFPRGAVHGFDLEFRDLRLPVLLGRGARAGRRLVVTAGVHGDEYEGVRAILEVFRELRTDEMSGDLLAVPVANPPAFWNGTRTSPLDGGNLARVFPGREDGGPTAAIAWVLARHVIPLADLYLDLHSGGVQCAMPTLAGYNGRDARSREAALQFGAPVVWGHPETASGRTVSTAGELGIPWLYAEARGGGRVDPEDMAIYRRGVWNLLRHLRIVPGRPETGAEPLRLWGAGNIDESLSARQAGFLIPEVELLDEVEQGQRLGALVDLKGNCIEEFRAPEAGRVVLIHACPRVLPGEPLFLVSGVETGN